MVAPQSLYRLAHTLNRADQESDQKANDGDNDDKLNQLKTAPPTLARTIPHRNPRPPIWGYPLQLLSSDSGTKSMDPSKGSTPGPQKSYKKISFGGETDMYLETIPSRTGHGARNASVVLDDVCAVCA
jgi:hypothetical protein